MSPVIVQESNFSRNVSALLKQIEYRRCESGEDLEAVYRLRYDSYLASGMISEHPSRLVKDEYDDLENAFVFGIFIDGFLASTIRIHHVNLLNPTSPSLTAFRDELEPRIISGESFIDPSRFASDVEYSRNYRALPYVTLRIAVVACEYFDVDYCLSSIKQDHAKFYQRIFGSQQKIPLRDYPGLVCPVQLFQSKCSENLSKTLERFPFFRSSRMEQRLLFAAPRKGEPAPLTILPTARYLDRIAA